MKSERFLATVLFTDIVGSTERAAEVGDRRWHDLLRRHHAIVRGELRRCGGRELNTTGDGFLATFDRPERGIRCACAVRDRVRALGLEIRGGLHAGEVELVENTVGGIAVHTAARVAAAAGPGEVLVSGALRDFVAGSGFTFEDRGTHALKGVPGDWRLYAVDSEPVRLEVTSFWERAREARLPRVLLLYLLAAAAVLALTGFLQSRFGLPPWTFPLAILLLVIGLVMIGATAWVQAQALPGAPGAGSGEAPGSWELDLPGVGRSVARGRLPHLTWSRSILGGVVAFSLLFGLAGLYVVVKDRGRTFAPSEAVAEAAAPGIAVLPFSIRGEGLDVWREGMVDVLSTNLDGAGGLRGIDSRTVLARWRERVSGEGAPDLQTSLDVARATGARYALVGNALTTGPDVRFASTIYDVRDGATLGRAEAVGPPDSVLSLANQLSIEVLRAVLHGTQTELPWLDVASLTTASVPALKAYLQGEALFRRSDFEGAVAAYRRALEADSTFALALYRLGDAYGWLENVESELAHDFLGRAARAADRLPQREALLLRGLGALDRGTLDAVEVLRQAVRRYPDDAEAWFLLGDTHFHLGAQALARPEEGIRALERAVELDPGFSPYYQHLVDDALLHGDSARAFQLVETYARLAPRSETLGAYQHYLHLAFGDAAAREQALASLDTLSTRFVGPYTTWMRHPRYAAEFGHVAAILKRREAASLFSAHIRRGRLGDALRELDSPLLDAAQRGSAVFRLHQLGVAHIEPELDPRLDVASTDDGVRGATFYAGAWAAERGRWSDHGEALRRLQQEARHALAEGDSVAAHLASGEARALEALALWKREQPAPALNVLQPLQRQLTGHSSEVRLNQTLRWWVGELLLELGRPGEAAPYFESLILDNPPDPFAAYRLGRIHEELDEPAKAQESYEHFALAWKDADPELQPMVEDARARAQRLAAVSPGLPTVGAAAAPVLTSRR